VRGDPRERRAVVVDVAARPPLVARWFAGASPCGGPHHRPATLAAIGAPCGDARCDHRARAQRRTTRTVPPGAAATGTSRPGGGPGWRPRRAAACGGPRWGRSHVARSVCHAGDTPSSTPAPGSCPA